MRAESITDWEECRAGDICVMELERGNWKWGRNEEAMSRPIFRREYRRVPPALRAGSSSPSRFPWPRRLCAAAPAWKSQTFTGMVWRLPGNVRPASQPASSRIEAAPVL
jgi:hypothetical protein